MSDHLSELFSEEFKQEPEVENAEPEVTQEIANTYQEPEVEAEIEPVIEAEEIEAPEPEKAKEPKYVPLPTFLEMIDTMKGHKEARAKAEAEAAAFQKELEDYRREVTQTFDQPDPLADPRGFTSAVEQKVKEHLWNDRLARSVHNANQKHGDEIAQAALAWGQAREEHDRQFSEQIYAQQDPAEWVIQQHKAASQLEAFRTDPIAAAKKIAMEQGWFAQGAAQVAPTVQPQKAKSTPKSLTDVPTATTASKGTTGDIAADFNAIFDR